MSGPLEGRRYRLVEALGRGGFGTVYRAELLGAGGFQKAVALKVLNPEIEGAVEVARRLRDEARVLGLLRHRAIVAVDGLVQLSGRWTVVMEYVEGADLRNLVEAAGRVPESSALEIAGEVAAALHVAWEQKGPDGKPLRLLHRDIKPSNIQVTAAGEVKLLDFGVARADFGEREAVTKSNLFGSLGYMSPERLDLNDGPAGDVYSLGVTLWEMLAAEKFGQTSARADKHEVRRLGALQRLREIGGNDDVIGLIDCLLAYEPGDRPTAKDLERLCIELRAKLGGEPLRYWAERIVPDARGRRRPVMDPEMSGSILVEQSVSQGGDPWGPPPLPPRRSGNSGVVRSGASGSVKIVANKEQEEDGPTDPGAAGGDDIELEEDSAPVAPARPTSRLALWLRVGMAAGALGVALLALAAVVVWRVVTREEAEPALEAEEEAAAEQEAAPDDAAPAASLAAPAPSPAAPAPSPATPAASSSPNPTSSTGTGPAAAAQPRKSAADPAASSSEKGSAAKGTWKAAGDANSVALVKGGKSFPPGAIPAGSYQIRADFGGGALDVGAVKVEASRTLTVTCSAAFTRCVPRSE